MCGNRDSQLPKVNAELVSGGLGPNSDMSVSRSSVLGGEQWGQATENKLHVRILVFKVTSM